MFLLYFLCIILSQNQILRLDSRDLVRKQLNMNLFQQQFSIWFTFSTETNIDKIELFKITNYKYLIVKIFAQQKQLIVTYDEDQNFEIKDNQIKKNQWIHMVVNQNQNFQNDEFYIKTSINIIKEYQFKINSKQLRENESLISQVLDSYVFCLIYDRLLEEIQPIILFTNLQLLINQERIHFQSYHSDSAFELFLKKNKQKYELCNIIDIYSELTLLFQVIDFESKFQILIQNQVNFMDYIQRIKSWFRLLITFNNYEIYYEIQFVDEKIKYSFKNINRPQMFYQILLTTLKSNYQFMKFTTYFKSKEHELFDEKQLLSYKNCNENIRSYYDIQKNECNDYLNLDQIQIIQYVQEFDVNKLDIKRSIWDNVGQAISKQVLQNLTSQVKYPFIEYFDKEIQFYFGKEPFLLWIYFDQVFCTQNYFGQYCNKYIKNCLYAQNNYCSKCVDGYLAVRNKCFKCPQNCLICILDFQQFKCLLPKINHFVNKYYQARPCMFQYCNINGSLVSKEEAIKQIQQCFQDSKCFLKDCVQTNQYFRLAQQDCFTLSKDQWLQIYYYLFYQVKQYYQGLEDIQFILVLNYQLYGATLTSNIISDYYFILQMDSYLKNFLEQNFEHQTVDSQYQNRYNLDCVQKNLDNNGDITCKKYIKRQNNKCTKLPCFYRLEIKDIQYYIGEINYVEYNNGLFSSLLLLLQQVKNIGVRFDEVYLQINFIIQSFDEHKIREEIIDFSDKSIFPMFKNSSIIIDLILQQQVRINIKYFNLSINADQIRVQQQIINIPLFLNIKADVIDLNGLIITSGVNLQFNTGLLFTIQLVEIYNDFELTVQYFQIVDIQDILSFNQSCFSILLFKIQKLNIINLQLLKDEKICMIDNQIKKVFNFYQVLFTKLALIRFKFDNNYEQTLIQVGNGKELTIQNIQVSINKVNSSNLFVFSSISLIKIMDCTIQVSQFAHSVFLMSESSQLSIRYFEHISDLFFRSNLFQIKSEQVQLIQINSTLKQFDSFLFIQSYCDKLLIIEFYLNQNSDSNMGSNYFYEGYLIELLQISAKITNLCFNGIQVSNYGLVSIKSRILSFLDQLTITNVKFHTSIHHQVVSIEDESTFIINLLISNLQIDDQGLTTSHIIDIRNSDNFQLRNCSISKIYFTHQTNSFIFYFNSSNGKINEIVVTDCQNVNMISILSLSFEISKLNYSICQNSRIIDVSSRKPKMLIIHNSTMILQQTKQVIYANPLTNLRILIQNVHFYFYNISDYFFLQGTRLLIILDRISINQYSSDEYENSLYGIFRVRLANLQVQNMVVKNLSQPLFYITKAQKVLFSDLHLQNAEIDSDFFLFYIQDSHLILQNLQFISFKNLDGIFYIASEIGGFIYVSNVYVHDLKNVTSIFEVQTNITYQISFMDIFIQNLLQGYIFKFGFGYPQEIQVQNLFVNNVDNFQIKEVGTQKLNLNNSIVNMKKFNLSDPYLKVKLIRAEIIYEQELHIHQIQFDRSYIYNILKSTIVMEKKFIITLSLNYYHSLKSIQLDAPDEEQQTKYLISQSGSLQYYFYVPSGLKISGYKQLNFNNLQYEQVYQGLYLVVQGFINGHTQYKLQCSQQQFYNDKIVIQQEFDKLSIQEGLNEINEYFYIINPFNANYTVFKITCSSNIDDKLVQLQYNVKAFPCQLGEFLFKNQCIECNISYNQYSVNYNSNKCNYIDPNQIKSARKGLLQLNQNYWRYSFTSNIIEYCQKNFCNGGWIPGDKSCIISRIGALCEECDIYNIRGDGSFTKSNQSCLQCEGFTIQLIIKFLFTILWQLLLILNGYYTNYKLSQQYLMFRIGFRQYYQVLYRQSIDVPSIIIKMFANYIFMLYIIKSNLNITGYTFVNNVNIINNPGLITKAQMDCILSQLFEMDIIYSSFVFQIVIVFFIITITYTLYLVIIQIKKMRFELGLILYATEGIIIYNLNIILVMSYNLLSYQIASGQKWIKYNMQYLFFTDMHLKKIHYIIPATVAFMAVPLLFPTAIKSLSAFNRQVKKIYAIYHQEYNPKYIFWEYLILYIKYGIMIFQNINQQSNQNVILIIWLMCMLSVNLKPYYLQNLNVLECNLYFTYGIQLLLLFSDTFKDEIIILLNLIISLYVAFKFQFTYINYNLRNIIQWKLKLISKFNWAKRFSGIEKNQRQLKNKLSFIYLVKSQILKKSYQASTVNQITLQTEQEIEMPIIFKQIQQKIPQTREEVINY